MTIPEEEGGRRSCSVATRLQTSYTYHDATRRSAEIDKAPLTAQAHADIAAGATALRQSCSFAPACTLEAGQNCPIVVEGFQFLATNAPGPNLDELFGL